MPPRRSHPGQRAPRPLRAVSNPPIRELYRGRRRDALMMDLAMQAMSIDEIANRENLDPQDLEEFAVNYAQEILAIREAMTDRAQIDTAGLWIADKRARLVEIQAEIEDIDDTLEELRGNSVGWSRAHRDMLRVKLDLYRQAADELGAYPQRQAAPARQRTGVVYVIESEDTDAMT